MKGFFYLAIKNYRYSAATAIKPKFAAILFFLLMAGFYSFAQPGAGAYAIKNVQTGMLLRIKDANTNNGTPLVLYTPENWKCMTWNFKPAGADDYQLENLFSHKTFQPKQMAAEGIQMEEQPLVINASNQLYEFLPLTKSVYLIRMKGTDLYISAADNGKPNSPVVLAKKTGSSLQQWIIYEQHPTM
jgi:hypothetical protein